MHLPLRSMVSRRRCRVNRAPEDPAARQPRLRGAARVSSRLLRRRAGFPPADRAAPPPLRTVTAARLVGSLLRRLSPALRGLPYRLQSQMDIHPRSLWHNPGFARDTGGFHPPGERGPRTIEAADPGDSVRRDMLVLLMRDLETRGVAGSLAELGVYRGQTARLIHHYLPDRRIHLFDTFAGFDERDAQAEARATGAEVAAGQFGGTSVEAVRRRVAPVNGNVVFHPGTFPESCGEPVRRERFAFVHLDADLQAPTRAGLEVFYPLTAPGGYIIVHDYNAWPGARSATDSFFADKPETPVPMPDKSGSAVIVKGAA